MKNADKILIEYLKEETFWKPRHRQEDNIMMNIKETQFEDVDWIHLTQDRVQ
jgi:hypothetical protein